MQIQFLKWLDSVVGGLVAGILPAAPAREAAVPHHILLIRPGGIGDAVLLIPAILALKEKFPEAEISVLAERRNGAVFALCPAVDHLLFYDSPYDLIKAIRGGYDVVIDTEQWHRLSAIVARLCRASVKIGFDTNERRRMFTHAISYSHDDYEVASFAHLLEPLGIAAGPVGKGTPFLSVPEAASVTAAALLETLHDAPFVAIFPGASIPERRWGADRFRRLTEMLSVSGIRVVVVGGKEDQPLGDVVAGAGLGLNLADLTSLAETAAVIHKSSLLVSGDSGVLHIAVGLGTPTVSLFGPGRSRKWAPKGGRHVVINKGLPCSPCTTFGTTPPCPFNAKCLRDIGVDEVVNAVTMVITSVGAMPSKCCKRDWIET